jgi:hypothetical protein
VICIPAWLFKTTIMIVCLLGLAAWIIWTARPKL